MPSSSRRTSKRTLFHAERSTTEVAEPESQEGPFGGLGGKADRLTWDHPGEAGLPEGWRRRWTSGPLTVTGTLPWRGDDNSRKTRDWISALQMSVRALAATDRPHAGDWNGLPPTVTSKGSGGRGQLGVPPTPSQSGCGNSSGLDITVDSVSSKLG